jgi:Flp pilus assembly protein TadB
MKQEKSDACRQHRNKEHRCSVCTCLVWLVNVDVKLVTAVCAGNQAMQRTSAVVVVLAANQQIQMPVTVDIPHRQRSTQSTQKGRGGDLDYLIGVSVVTVVVVVVVFVVVVVDGYHWTGVKVLFVLP